MAVGDRRAFNLCRVECYLVLRDGVRNGRILVICRTIRKGKFPLAILPLVHGKLLHLIAIGQETHRNGLRAQAVHIPAIVPNFLATNGAHGIQQRIGDGLLTAGNLPILNGIDLVQDRDFIAVI